jgi:DNA/RNA-binding protein KIN17
MNATRFTSLTEFCKHLGRTGVAHVDETEKGWFISWIDNSPRALAKAEANQKKERGDMDDETRQRKLIQEQIERARREGEKRRAEQAAAAGKVIGEGGEVVAGEEEVSRELKRDEGERVSLSLSFKATPTAATLDSTSGIAAPAAAAATDDVFPSTSTIAPTSAPVKAFVAPPPKPVIGFTPKPSAFKANPLKVNPLKKPNPLKAGSSTSSASSAGSKRAAPMSAVEAIVAEEMARKQRRTN